MTDYTALIRQLTAAFSDGIPPFPEWKSRDTGSLGAMLFIVTFGAAADPRNSLETFTPLWDYYVEDSTRHTKLIEHLCNLVIASGSPTGLASCKSGQYTRALYRLHQILILRTSVSDLDTKIDDAITAFNAIAANSILRGDALDSFGRAAAATFLRAPGAGLGVPGGLPPIITPTITVPVTPTITVSVTHHKATLVGGTSFYGPDPHAYLYPKVDDEAATERASATAAAVGGDHADAAAAVAAPRRRRRGAPPPPTIHSVNHSSHLTSE